MNNNINRVIIKHSVKHLVHLQMGSNRVTVRQEPSPKINVISLGAQGPVGSIAENVLVMAQEAKALASEAKEKALEASQSHLNMVSSMSLTLDHFIGAIEAQE